MIHDYLTSVLPDEFNQSVIQKLKSMPKWCLDTTEDDNPDTDGGISIKIYKENIGTDPDLFVLWHIGETIFNTILKKTKQIYKDVELDRVYVNYYNRSSSCGIHRDGQGYDQYGRKEVSCLYFLNTSKGSYLKVGDDKFDSISGNAVIFDSEDLHSATGAVDDKERLTMNLFFRYINK